MKKKIVSTVILTALFFMFSNPAHVFAQEKECKSVIEIKQVEAQKTIVIKADIPTNSIGSAMGKAYEKLFGFLSGNNIVPAGSPFTVYYSFDPIGNTVFEAGVPVNAPVEGNNEITYKEFPAMKVVSTLYKGAYDAMEPVYGEIDKYIKTNGLESTGTSWEVYLTDPNQLKDQNDNQTIVYFPIK